MTRDTFDDKGLWTPQHEEDSKSVSPSVNAFNLPEQEKNQKTQEEELELLSSCTATIFGYIVEIFNFKKFCWEQVQTKNVGPSSFEKKDPNTNSFPGGGGHYHARGLVGVLNFSQAMAIAWDIMAKCDSEPGISSKETNLRIRRVKINYSTKVEMMDGILFLTDGKSEEDWKSAKENKYV